jgi:hypothetical protein
MSAAEAFSFRFVGNGEVDFWFARDSAGTIHVLSSPQLRHVGNSIEKPSSAPVESASACDASAVYTDPDERIK